jgi:error-prone DNA polymerase
VEGNAIRLGFGYISGLGEAGTYRIIAARRAGPFTSLADFCRRTCLPRRLVEDLILVGAMDGRGDARMRATRTSEGHAAQDPSDESRRLPRRKLLWELGKLHYHEEELDLAYPDDDVELAPFSRAEEMAAEYGVLGLSPGDHVMALYSAWFAEQGILGSRDLKASRDGEQVAVAGLKVVHQAPPTARGYHFITLEDEDGVVDVVVRPDVYTRYRPILHQASVMIVEGVVQRKDGVVNLLALRVSEGVPQTAPPSRAHLLLQDKWNIMLR